VHSPTTGGGAIDVEWRRPVVVTGIEPEEIASAVWDANKDDYTTD